MNRAELEHAVRCSVRIERMMATFNGRVDSAITFAQIALGASVFASIASDKITGGALVLFSVWAFVYRPAQKAASALQQKQRYEALCVEMASLSDQEIAERLNEIGDKDSNPLQTIARAAENAEHNNVGSRAPFRIPGIGKIILYIAGD